MTDKRYQLRQEDLDYPIYFDLVDIENNDKVICTFLIIIQEQIKWLFC